MEEPKPEEQFFPLEEVMFMVNIVERQRDTLSGDLAVLHFENSLLKKQLVSLQEQVKELLPAAEANQNKTEE